MSDAPGGLARRVASGLGLIVLAVALVFSCDGTGPGTPVAHAAGSIEKAPAPAFHARDLDGHDVSLVELRARGPVLVDFWATWCTPCRAALTELEDWRKRYGPRGLSIVAVSVDGPRNLAKVRPYVARLRVGFPVVVDDDGAIQGLYQVTELPTAVLVDTAGRVVATRVGFRRGETGLATKLESLLPPE
jgi:thiol-disulfide isomerase/thioredoxin